jgi:hypothetical protein
MTATILPFQPAAQSFDEKRLKAFLRDLPPLTPDAKQALLELLSRQEECALALEQYDRNVALNGISDRSRLNKILPEFAKARRDALIALGVDPNSNLLPPIPGWHDA